MGGGVVDYAAVMDRHSEVETSVWKLKSEFADLQVDHQMDVHSLLARPPHPRADSTPS